MNAPSLCHVFAFVTPGAPEAAALEAAGLRESFRRAHPGQGTANACWCFDNAYLELLWVEDAAALAGPAIARTHLAERARWRETGASPFGIAVRGATPFAAWTYAPPYLPAGLSIPVALSAEDPRQPFLFRSPGDARPDAWTDGRAGGRQAAAGLAEIAGVHLEVTVPPSDDLRALEAAGLLTLSMAEAPRMVLTLSRRDGGAPRHLSLPDVRWENGVGASRP
ncbi:MAG TPA: VOC family protein [Azospirillum sp.]